MVCSYFLLMANQHLYAHQETTRRLDVAIAAVIGMILVALGLNYAAPIIFMIPVLAALLMACWFFLIARQSGCLLDATQLQLYAGRWSKDILVRDIVAYRKMAWSESPDWIHLRLRDNTEYLVPAYCVGNTDQFVEALRQLNVSEAKI
jgi:hypothetical protein